MGIKALGIFREIQHSPDRESDDLEILRLTGEHLSKNLELSLRKPDEVILEKDHWAKNVPNLVFVMCEQEKILKVLKKWEEMGATVVNSPGSILNTYRHRMIPLMGKAKIPFPKSILISTEDKIPVTQCFVIPAQAGIQTGRQIGFLDSLVKPGKDNKIWIKRGDVHNTQKGDVCLVHLNGSNIIPDALDAFRKREIETAVLQEDVPGDLIKFYGIGGQWFKWFYHKNQNLKHTPFSETVLKNTVNKAVSAMGLEVYGGDAIVSDERGLFVIDINAWPSFALFREEASKEIANYLLKRVKQ